MSDIIQLLPDSVANQIAAGEVIQRPASVVKELLENSVDAGSSSIQLIIKEAGRTLIQVIDNGCGMSPTDARLCFERHATSKIKNANDLFNIRSKGFRGEAMASIAAIAHVELKTRLHDEELGTLVELEGTEVKKQEPCQAQAGSSISVKNLFFNVPARRNFLKSNAVETKHIIDEFQRVALAHPDIEFSMHHNGQEVFKLTKGPLRQRIVQLLGGNSNQKLVPLEEETSIVKLKGFICKPEFAKKTRGEQFFFVNNRFIKSSYLNHAVMTAYDDLISKNSFPSYFIYMEVDPSFIDINIHPTKTEIKFEDERSIYAIMRSTVKQSLGKYNIAPTIDFDQETSLNIPPLPKNKQVFQPEIKHNPDFNPFEAEKKQAPKPRRESPLEKMNRDNWGKLYKNLEKSPEREFIEPGEKQVEQPSQETEPTPQKQQQLSPDWEAGEDETERKTFQVHNRYIITTLKSGLVLIDQHRAHERVLYEKIMHSMEKGGAGSQKELFPRTIELPPNDFELLIEMSEDVRAMGIDLRVFGKNTFVVEGTASYIPANTDLKALIEEMLESYKNEGDLDKKDKLARALADRSAVKHGQVMHKEEMNNLIDELFACSMPYYTPSGKPVVITIPLDELEKRFAK